VSPLSRVVRYALPPLLLAGAIFLVSSRSRLPGPPLVYGLDKVVHFAVYALLGLLTVRGFAGYGLRACRAALWAVLACALYGASDELHQHYVPGRSSDPADWVADVLGAALAVRLWWAAWRRRSAAVYDPEAVP
jgi:VanZ family protein